MNPYFRFMRFDHFIIRPAELTDAEKYFELIEKNRPRLEDFFVGTVSNTQTFEDTVAFMKNNLKRTERKEYYPFFVLDESTDKIIGFIDAKNVEWYLPKTEIGCYIDHDYEGQGVSSKALKLVIAHLFNVHQFVKIYLRTHDSNLGARKLAEKCGFQLEGMIRKDYQTTAGEYVDLCYYGLLNPQLFPEN